MNRDDLLRGDLRGLRDLSQWDLNGHRDPRVPAEEVEAAIDSAPDDPLRPDREPMDL